MRQAKVAPILVVDSGVGGLSIQAHIQRRLPWVPCLYVADSAAFPYGTKSEDEVLWRVVSLVETLVGIHRPALVVIACNTASTLVLPHLRARLNIPVVGVVPAIKTAAALSQTRQIGLLATPATVRRDYTLRLIEEFAGDCQVVRVGSGDLVHLAEAYVQGREPSPEQLGEILAPFFQEGLAVDAIVLGCTHFPLLRPVLEKAVPKPVRWVDSGEAIARRVEQLLGQMTGLELPSRSHNFVGAHNLMPVRNHMLCTRPYEEAMVRGIQRLGFERVEVFDFDPAPPLARSGESA